ncbi:MAG: SCO family protein [Bacteroidota bacterium]
MLWNELTVREQRGDGASVNIVTVAPKPRCSVTGLLFVVAVILNGCASKEEKKETTLVTFPLKGEVVSIDTAKSRVTIAHEEIPDYMMAMTMPFKVKDRSLFHNLQVGDSVQGTLAVSRTESWLETLAVIGGGEAPQTMTAEEIGFRKLFREGEPIPDFSFVNQDGKRVRFSDYRGKVLAFTLIYSRCPIPDFCIRMSDYFARIQKTLGKDPVLRGKWHLMSVSFDPKNDTPEVLKAYGNNYGADFSTWEFVVDKLETIQSLGDGLDLTFYDDEGGLIAHNLRTVLIDPQGRLAHVIKDNEWKPEEVVELIRKLAR